MAVHIEHTDAVLHWFMKLDLLYLLISKYPVIGDIETGKAECSEQYSNATVWENLNSGIEKGLEA